MTQSHIVTCARAWIGTPYHHGAALKGAGCDCLGLVRGVYAEVTQTPLYPVDPYTPDWNEPNRSEALWASLASLFPAVEIQAAQPGDVLLFRMLDQGVAKHLGILSSDGDRPSFIHAYQGRGVVQSPLSDPWRRRIVAAFSVETNLIRGA